MTADDPGLPGQLTACEPERRVGGPLVALSGERATSSGPFGREMSQRLATFAESLLAISEPGDQVQSSGYAPAKLLDAVPYARR